MSRKMTATHPTHGPFYLVSPTGGTVKLVGPSGRRMADLHVKEFGMQIISVDEWRLARRRQNREEAP